MPKEGEPEAAFTFSPAIRYLLRQIRTLSAKKFGAEIDTKAQMHLLMELIFRFVVEAILDPLKYYIVFEISDDDKQTNNKKNLIQLSESLKLLFKGETMPTNTWLEGINDFISKRARSQKEKIL